MNEVDAIGYDDAVAVVALGRGNLLDGQKLDYRARCPELFVVFITRVKACTSTFSKLGNGVHVGEVQTSSEWVKNVV